MFLQRTEFAVASTLVRPVRQVAVLCAALLSLGTSAYAANTDIVWGFFPSPTSVTIRPGDTVTWNGDLAFHPVTITNASFSSSNNVVSAGGSTYTRAFPTAGTFYFMCNLHGSSMPTTVNVCSSGPFAVLDVDGDGQVDALTDGVLTLRYMLGLRGTALTSGALGTCASRDADAIATYLSTRVVP